MDKWASGQVRQLMGSQVNELSERSSASVKFARHITPLSPWRGVGGEAGSRVVSDQRFWVGRLLPLSSEDTEQVKEEVDEVEIKV